MLEQIGKVAATDDNLQRPWQTGRIVGTLRQNDRWSRTIWQATSSTIGRTQLVRIVGNYRGVAGRGAYSLIMSRTVMPAGDHRQHVLLIGDFDVEHVGAGVVDHFFEGRHQVGLLADVGGAAAVAFGDCHEVGIAIARAEAVALGRGLRGGRSGRGTCGPGCLA